MLLIKEFVLPKSNYYSPCSAGTLNWCLFCPEFHFNGVLHKKTQLYYIYFHFLSSVLWLIIVTVHVSDPGVLEILIVPVMASLIRTLAWTLTRTTAVSPMVLRVGTIAMDWVCPCFVYNSTNN